MFRIRLSGGIVAWLPLLVGGVVSSALVRTPHHVVTRSLPSFLHPPRTVKGVEISKSKKQLASVRELAKSSDEDNRRALPQNEGGRNAPAIAAFSAVTAIIGSGDLGHNTVFRANAVDDLSSSTAETTAKSTMVNPFPISHQQGVLGKSILLSLGDDESLSLMDTPAVSKPLSAEDDAGETVENTLRALKATAGDPEKSLKVFEDIAAVITEGRGVGGALSYTGAKLDPARYSVDEDTSIYNPGLSLLTESEKESLVEGIISNRKVGLEKGAWPEDNELGYDFLKSKLDPFHLTEIRGYLKILPFWGAAMYLLVLAIQQLARDFFAPTYIVAAGLVFGPIVALIFL